ncbi:hypothetical protein GobsT_63390 [Gemmata obscuriglobus]|uniref:Uncharacterized protein n=1 Tax=Gemmata obscuriglobus TaxID=114 RepID=A0A2Z3GWI1_9BACT|nr:hypothetical protein [Gemmata obscuriglobus]AWM35927.1 hypothetical protein C1280_02130 [Gemmata obscuriglobus]QEG31517.1 hypothetical protein GobsT_63390 [Gemmata obscuriglobus]VTS10859.1 unnamed protein product [Gemmata obscuriglobus UQM 2246]
MIQVHFHVHAPAPLPPDAFQPAAAPMPGDAPVGAEAIGDGTLLRLIGEYGPKLLALLIQLGLIKLPTTTPAGGVGATP